MDLDILRVKNVNKYELLKNAPILVHRLRFSSYDHLFVTNTADL
jgi:hypothetical protein